ncbi:MAG: hypothetical protein ACRD1X_15080 [Vicinamibacteria bacterium]
MTNTLHRTGQPEDLKDDYILFAMCTRGKNDSAAPERLRQFLTICSRHRPVNIGDGKNGGLFRPSRHLNPLAHWRRPESGSPEEVIAGITTPTTAAAVFDNREVLVACLKEVKAADLGLSINISALVDDAAVCSRQADIEPHAVEYSLGFMGNTSQLSDANTLSLTTMCGHGMVAHAFAEKMIDWVKTRRRSAAECARYMSRFCVCGVFNPVRAERLLCRMANQRTGG